MEMDMKQFPLLSRFALVLVFMASEAWAQRGDVAATYAFRNTWNQNYEYPNNCTNFVSKSWYEGGWRFLGQSPYYRASAGVWYKTPFKETTSYTWAGANNFENHLVVNNRATRIWDSSNLQPGDIIVADWGTAALLQESPMVPRITL